MGSPITMVTATPPKLRTPVRGSPWKPKNTPTLTAKMKSEFDNSNCIYLHAHTHTHTQLPSKYTWPCLLWSWSEESTIRTSLHSPLTHTLALPPPPGTTHTPSNRQERMKTSPHLWLLELEWALLTATSWLMLRLLLSSSPTYHYRELYCCQQVSVTSHEWNV